MKLTKLDKETIDAHLKCGMSKEYILHCLFPPPKRSKVIKYIKQKLKENLKKIEENS